MVLDPDAGERDARDGVVPFEGSMDQIADGIRSLSEAGADEIILVLSPITERSIRDLGEMLTRLRT